MPDHSTLNLEELLKYPQVEKATGDINAELLERRNYAPPRCSVFSHPYTVLQETDRYRFELDREAERQLPDIISNKVQLIRGEDTPDDELVRKYGKKRNIGISDCCGTA